MYEIYLITNNLNDKKYVGLTSQGYLSRFTSHCSQGFYLTSTIKKYGKENFNIQVLATAPNKEEAAKLEIQFIKEYNCITPIGYNISEGGSTPCHTQSVKDKISKSSKGKKKSPEHTIAIQKASKLNGEKRKGIDRPEFTEEWKHNMSEAAKGKVHTEEHKANISKALRSSEKAKNADKGKNFRNNNPSHNLVIKELVARKKWKAIYCESLDLCFLSLKHAAEYLDIVSNRISTAMFRGSKINGLTFSYIQK
jgi:group I intron endonuclease